MSQYQLTASPMKARLSETTKLYPVIVIIVPPASDPEFGYTPVINAPKVNILSPGLTGEDLP